MADDVIYLATITKDDYPAFRSLPGSDFPNTYDEWLNLLKDHTAHHQEAGDILVFVRANADEFVYFCRANGSPHNLNSFYRFIKTKRLGQQNQ